MKNAVLIDEKALLAKIAKGDQKAFRVIYERYSRRVFLFAMRILNSEVHAEEIMQEAMLKIWLMGEELCKITNFEAYLRVLTRNKSLNVLAKLELDLKTNRIHGEDWDELENITQEAILLKDTRKILEQGIEALPPQQKMVYMLHREKGLKYDQIAKQLNLSSSTVQTHMKLAIKFLRAYISKRTDLGIILIFFKLF